MSIEFYFNQFIHSFFFSSPFTQKRKTSRWPPGMERRMWEVTWLRPGPRVAVQLRPNLALESRPTLPAVHLRSPRFPGRWRWAQQCRCASRVQPGPHICICCPNWWARACFDTPGAFCFNCFQLKRTKTSFCFFSFLLPCCFTDFPSFAFCTTLYVT